jgi:hypothetical protein
MVMALLGTQAGAQEGLVLDTSSTGRLEMSNGLVRVVFEKGKSGYSEKLFARAGRWRLVLRNGSRGRDDPALKSDFRKIPVRLTEAQVVEQSQERISVALKGKARGHTLSKTYCLEPGEKCVRVAVEDLHPGVAELSYLLSSYSFVPDGRPYRSYRHLDFVWTPQLRPDGDDVIADHTFRSPAIILQKGGVVAALMPAVETIQPWRTLETAADLQVETSTAPFFSYGAMNWKTRSHVFYTHSDKMTTLLADSRFAYSFTLYLSARENEREGYRDVVRLLWKTYGEKNLLAGPSPQREPFSAYVRKAWKEYLPAIALDTVYGGEPVTLLRQYRLAWSNKLPPAADNDCWFTVWFNALRTAYGAYLHGSATGDTALSARAERVLNLALLAPDVDGLAPSIFYVDSDGGHWVNDQGWGGIEGGRYYSTFNNAWTGCWLLAWSDILPARKEEIISRARRLGDFLVAHQDAGGVIPSWFDPAGMKPAVIFRRENAETAGSAYFLAELYARTSDPVYLAAAEKGMGYIAREIVPSRKWFDFETFFSCARKEIDFFDAFTCQYPQNTLSIHQAAEAARVLYGLTGKESYRQLGIGLIDYLALYQQVWSPPWLSRELLGGFGVQNTDAEWSDARQGYFAVTLARYYSLTGRREYLERAVAALRAMFSLFETAASPRTTENYAHDALDRPGGVTGIHWGTGSSVTSIHILQGEFGDAFVQIGEGWGVGIDGCTVQSVRVRSDSVQVSVVDIVGVHREMRMKFAGMTLPHYSLSINGKVLGPYSSKELEGGIGFDI